MKKWQLLPLAVLIYPCAYAQIDTLNEKDLEEAVVYSSKFAERKKFLVQRIDLVTAKTIARTNGQNTGDLLLNTGNIFIQKSQQGGSSPVIRGFEASRVLIVVDGIRHNTAIFRSGHLQNVITIDQNMLEQVEVMYGPSSTLYGSDALGGIVHLRTRSPKLSENNHTLIKGTAFTRWSSANDEKTVHTDINIGRKKWGALGSLTISDFGDMRMGRRYPSDYPGFGRRDSVIARFGLIDSVVANSDPEVQRYSGYRQYDLMQKVTFRSSEKITHVLNLQYSTTSNVPRYDRLQDKRNFGGTIGTTFRFAEWFYGPQKRFLGAYELNAIRRGPFDELKLNVNYQNVEESRQQREYRRYDRFDSRRERVGVWGLVLDGRKKFGDHELTMGMDMQRNDVVSRADRTNLITGAKSKLDTRYPDGTNRMNYVGLYAQHLMKFGKGKLILNDGIRLQYVGLRSRIVDNSFFNLPVTRFRQNHVALTGNLGLIYMPRERTRITAGLSSAFRAPNIDDLAKVFDFSIARRIYVPNPDIDPEYTYNIDLGLQQLIGDRFRIECTGFYTHYSNAIVSAPFRLNGQDSILYNSVKSAVYANQNLNKGRTYGFQAMLRAELTKHLILNSTASWTRGRLTRFNGSTIPQDHIPPFLGKTSLIYEKPRFGLELFSLYNGWKRIADYNPDGEDNQQYATADGTPAWMTLNWRAHWDLNKYLRVQVALENLLDRNYRYFASGFSAPGRNILIALRANW